MPLTHYGVAIGTLDHFARESPTPDGSWYHGRIYLRAPEGVYQCSIDVATATGEGVQYQVVTDLDASLFAPLQSLANGRHDLVPGPMSGALDYLRAPLLATSTGAAGAAGWIDSVGENMLAALEARVTGSARLFVFGEPYLGGDRLGMHNIHQVQGDPPGPHQQEDGVWQDGGVIAQGADGSLVAVIVKFATQATSTDDNGLPLASA